MAPPPPSKQPPPSQKGKFKPRKPAPQKTVIRPGAATASASTTGDNNSSSSNNNNTSSNPHVAFAPGTAAGPPPHPHQGGSGGRSSGSNSNRRDRRGDGRGGRGGGYRGGRGGGRGRGRGRLPMPRGRVFFTGDGSGDGTQEAATARAAPAAASVSAAATSNKNGNSSITPGGARVSGGPVAAEAAVADADASTATTSATTVAASSQNSQRRRLNNDDMDTANEEEVVGILETGVGGARGDSREKMEAAKKKKIKSEDDDDDMDFDEDGEGSARTRTKSAKTSIDNSDLDRYGILYDSDSSDDDDEDQKEAQSERSGVLDLTMDEASTRLEPMELPFPSRADVKPAPVASAATSAGVENNTGNVRNDMLDDANSWFLFQLPTRLPPLKQQQQQASQIHLAPDEAVSSTVNDTGTYTELSTTGNNNVSEVVTAPVRTNAFDNQLQGAATGRLGKILVYKSGKTVFVMDSPNGGPEIRMEMNQGLSCSFRQEAVVIDTEKGEYIALGDVNKSIVVSPDLDSLLQS